MNEIEQSGILLDEEEYLGEEAYIDSQILLTLNQKDLQYRTIRLLNELDEYEQAIVA